ncbi:MAG: GPR endopeptidase [Eubacteriales bacterium]|nr:GPR endopeptidase [Eubacteriales bacterium]
MELFHTDLALELQEELAESQSEETEGYTVQTRGRQGGSCKETVIHIKDERGERLFGKPEGVYITLEGEDLAKNDGGYHEGMSRLLAEHMETLLRGKENILFAGLGNVEVTPDALGPLVIDNLFVTGHLSKMVVFKGMKHSYAIRPGVMAQTGMETGQILQAVAEKIRPDAIVLIDALAAKTYERLYCTIQISDSGLVPGAGVGNRREEISERTMGIPVISLGIPTVISLPALAGDILSSFWEAEEEKEGRVPFDSWSEREKYRYMAQKLPSRLFSLMVTPKEVDEAVKRIGYTISEGLNQVIARRSQS